MFGHLKQRLILKNGQKSLQKQNLLLQWLMKWQLVLQTMIDHRPIPWFEHMQRHCGARESHHIRNGEQGCEHGFCHDVVLVDQHQV